MDFSKIKYKCKVCGQIQSYASIQCDECGFFGSIEEIIEESPEFEFFLLLFKLLMEAN